jgi:hypothetical protein
VQPAVCGVGVTWRVVAAGVYRVEGGWGPVRHMPVGVMCPGSGGEAATRCSTEWDPAPSAGEQEV